MRVLAGVYNPIAFDGRVQRACEALAEPGDVTLVCPAGPAPPERLSFQVHEVRLPDGVAATPRRHAAFCRAFLRQADLTRPRVIVAHDCFMALPGWLASRRTGARLVYDAHELRVPASVRALFRPRTLVWYLLERLALRRAHLVIAANADRAGVMERHYRLGQRPTVVRNIPPAPAPAFSAAAPAPTASRADVRFVYQGDLSLRRGVGRFVEAMAHVPPGYRLTLIGGGPDRDVLRSMAGQDRLGGRVALVDRVPRDDLAALLAEHHIGIVCYSFHGLNSIYCAPNKIFEYAHAGLPVVATGQPPLRAMVDGYGIGALVDADADARAVAAAMTRVAEGMAEYRARLAGFLEDHSWDAERRVLRDAVHALGAHE